MKWVSIPTALAFIGQIAASLSEIVTTSDLKGLLQNPIHPQPWMVAFIDPNCPHSQTFVATFNEIKSVFTGASFAKIDCTSESAFCKEQGIQFYPSLKFYRDGSFRNYDGLLDHDGLLSFLTKMTTASVKLLEHHQEIFHSDQLDDDISDVSFVFYPSEKTTKEFERISRRYQHLPVSFVSLKSNAWNDEWIGSISTQKLPYTLIRMERDISNHQLFREEFTERNLMKFVTDGLRSTIPELTSWNKHEYYNGHKFLVMAVLNTRNESFGLFLSELRNYVFKNLSPSLRVHYDFVWLDSEKWGETIGKFDVSDTDEPTFVVVEYPHEIYWNFPADTIPSMKNLNQFLTDVVEGNILPKYTVNNDDENEEDLEKDFNLLMLSPLARDIEYLQKHRYFKIFLLLCVSVNFVLLGSTYLSPSNKFSQFIDKHIWSKVDRIIECLFEGQNELAVNSKKVD
jgi:Thioredoxin domain-containing protein